MMRFQKPTFQFASYVRKASQIHPGLSPNLILAGGTGPYGASVDLLKWCSNVFKATYVLLDQDADAQIFKMPDNVYAINQTYHYLGDTGYILTDNQSNTHADIYVVRNIRDITSVPKNKLIVAGTGVCNLSYTNGGQIVANQCGHPLFTTKDVFFM